jgi:hypothetical protein
MRVSAQLCAVFGILPISYTVSPQKEYEMETIVSHVVR